MSGSNVLAADSCEYLPEEFPEREMELDQLEREFYWLGENGESSTIVVRGANGTGKTAVVLRLCEELQAHYDVRPIFVDGATATNEWELVQRIFHAVRQHTTASRPVKTEYMMKDELLWVLEDEINKLEYAITLVVDDVSIQTSATELLSYFLSEISGAQYSAMFITQDTSFGESLDGNEYSDCRFIDFPEYSREELHSIVQRRNNQLESPFPTQVIDDCVDHCQQYGYSVRAALEILSELANRRSRSLSQRSVDEQFKKASEWYSRVDSLNKIHSVDEQILCLLLSVLSVEDKKGAPATLNEVYKEYYAFGDLYNKHMFEAGVVDDLLNDLVRKGLLTKLKEGERMPEEYLCKMEKDMLYAAIRDFPNGGYLPRKPIEGEKFY